MSDNPSRRSPRRIVISVLITLVLAALYYYYSLPALNLHSTTFYSFVLIVMLVYILVSMIVLGSDAGSTNISLRDYIAFAKAQCKLALIVLGVLAAIFILGQVISLPVFRANAYHSLLTVDSGDFASEVEQVSFNEIPMLDESSARSLGNRKLGELSDMVSQFNVSTDYVQINHQNRPVRVAALEYADFFKWFANQKEGLPAYVKVDMVTQEVEVIRMSSLGQDGIRYSPSEYFNRDLNRTLRFNYPTYMFSASHLEIDEDGIPWWVCPRETRTIGLFGGADIIGAVLMNAVTGECVYYDIDDIPNWVDRVYLASLIMQQYDYYGTYVNGFINSIFGQRDVTVTTQGSNYIAMNDDVYMYTGITSVNSDQSNIGFLLSNQRTKETTYYSAPGAIEASAQGSAQGVVQDLGYTATFPLLLNIGGQPTYFMSLKDGSDLVKMYAMVNVAQYQVVATGNTVSACESNYLSLLAQNNIPTTNVEIPETGVSGVVAEIRTAVMNGNTYYFIRLEGQEEFYSISATTDQNVVLLNVGDSVTIQTAVVEEGAESSTILDGYSIAINDPEPPAQSQEPEE